ncbi:hypothetical protein [Peijinzhouia sedimentorum]
MVDVYDKLQFSQEIHHIIKKSQKPNGKVLLIKYRGENSSVQIKLLHKMSEKQVRRRMRAHRFKLIEDGKFMEIQHSLLFEIVE